MAERIPIEAFNGSLNEVILGTGDAALIVGGDASYPFHFFEGSLPHMPRIAMEVQDIEPKDWPKGVVEPFADALSSPVKWAQKCVNVYGAECIFLKLISTDPNREDRSPEEAAVLVKEVTDAVSIPTIVYGTGRKRKDALVLAEVARVCQGKNLFLGPVYEENLQVIADAAKEFGHGVIIQTGVEISPAKERNVKLSKILAHDRIMFDPTSMAIGYGIEFTYSLIEQVRQGALLVNDANLQMPFLANLGAECWSTREADESAEQGVIFEAMSSMTLLLAGANLVVVRHPDSYRLIRDMIAGGIDHAS